MRSFLYAGLAGGVVVGAVAAGCATQAGSCPTGSCGGADHRTRRVHRPEVLPDGGTYQPFKAGSPSGNHVPQWIVKYVKYTPLQ